ncbi:MAG: hypothetical protein HYW88_00215, partial [Candidatus Sungbacteria bacterium]|nr:hypothetical protein [Candidatus Sungbacteria bacterium]
PELFRSLYFPQSEDIEQFSLAETIPGPTTNELSKIAKAKKVVIIAPIFEKRAAGGREPERLEPKNIPTFKSSK